MVFKEQHRELKVEGEKWMKDTANSCSITAALIVTIVFAAAITVPGGNNSSGYPSFFGRKPAFITFAVSNVISLFSSATSLLMFLSILTSRFAEKDFLKYLPTKLYMGLSTLFISILFMITAYASTVFLVLANNKTWVLIPVTVLAIVPILTFSMLQFPLIVEVMSSTHGGGIFGKQSDRRFH